MSFDLWTLGFQAVNVLVLVWLLHRFFWKPVAGMIVTRQTAAATLLEEAEAARDAVMETARTEAETLRGTAKAARIRAAETLKETALEEAQGLALIIAVKLLARLDSAVADAAFLRWLEEGLMALLEAERKALTGADIDVVSATELDSAAHKRIAAAIA